MPVVTAITALPRQTGRVSIQVDGDELAVVSVEVASALDVRVHAEVTPEAREVLIDHAAALRTYDRALRMLAARGRSVRELRRKLLAAREPEPHVDAALERLQDLGLLDDGDYARQLARSQMLGRGYAPRRLQQELARRGVSREIADRAIDAVMTEEAAPGTSGSGYGIDPAQTLEGIARKKLSALGDLDDGTRSRRLYAFLARRGYERNEIRRIMTKLRAEEGASDPA